MKSEDIRKIRNTLSLHYSMVLCGENPSPSSEVARLEALRLLDEGLDESLKNERLARREFRATQIVSYLFPGFDAVRKRTDPDYVKPLQHPEKDWWWNSPSIQEYEDNDLNGVAVKLESYIGGNEYDDYRFNIPNEWLEASEEEYPALVLDWLKDRIAKHAEANKEQQRRQAEAELRAAEDKLARLRANGF